MSRPTLSSALRSARRVPASPAAGARSFGRAAIVTGLFVLGRALWLRAASRRFRRIRGTRVGALGAPRTALPAGGASGGPVTSGASWSSDRRASSGVGRSSNGADSAGPGRASAGGSSEGAGRATAGGSSEGAADLGYVDATAESLPPEESA